MKSSNSNKKSTILGVVTVNDKGQVVIPAEARSFINLGPGDKLVVLAHPGHDGLVLIKPDRLEEYANHMLEQISTIKRNN